MNINIAVLPGDGIGVEVTESAVRVLSRISDKYGHVLNKEVSLAGGEAIDRLGTPLPVDTLKLCKNSDAVLLGAVGGPKWDDLSGEKRPEAALLGLRGELELYINKRPVMCFKGLEEQCPLKLDKPFDIMIVRELTGGMYFGEKKRYMTENNGMTAYDMEIYSEKEIIRIGQAAFESAIKRNGKVTSVDKANVLESSRLWRETMHSVASWYPEVEYSDMLADNAAMQLIRDPSQFDVIVTTNMFGDILSDEAAQLTGSIGLLPSSSLGSEQAGGVRKGMYEPVHGTAHDIAGKNIANPVAAILSAAMLLEDTYGLECEGANIRNAVALCLSGGIKTSDIGGKYGTREFTDKVIEQII